MLYGYSSAELYRQKPSVLILIFLENALRRNRNGV